MQTEKRFFFAESNFFRAIKKIVPDRQIENETDCLLSLIIIILLFKAFCFFVLSLVDKQQKNCEIL